MRRSLLASLVLVTVLPACSSNGDAGDAAPSPAPSASAAPPAIVHPGDLGAGSAVIDHGGPDRGIVGAPPGGALAGTWQPPTCSGTVDLASGVSDAAWTEEAYDAADPSPTGVHASWRFETSTTLALSWITAPGTRASWVAMGDSPDRLDRFVAGVSFTWKPDPFSDPVRGHEVHVCGLAPGRTYYYAVGGDGYFGKVHAVKTAPAFDPAAKWRVGVVGDSNNLVYDDFRKTFENVAAEAPDWLAFTGDLVHDGAIQSQWNRWFAAAGDLIAEAPIMPAHGNHEALATAYFAQFALPGREEWYSFDYAQAHFVVLNDSPKDDATFAEEAKFLDDDLTAARAREKPPTWLVAMHHRPPFTSSQSSMTARASFSPIYDKHHVDLVLNGHQHRYESTLPVRADGTVAASTKEGTVYLVTGGAGGLLDSSAEVGQPEPFSRTLDVSFHHVLLEVDGSTITWRAERNDGSLIEGPVVLSK